MIDVKTFSNAVIAIGAITLVAIPVSNAVGQTLPNSRPAVKVLPGPSKQV